MILSYRVLDEPRPLVVGIAWVVECVEKRKHVEEDKFLIDLEGVNVAGVNKVSQMFSCHHRGFTYPLTAPTVDASQTNIAELNKPAIDFELDGAASDPLWFKFEWNSVVGGSTCGHRYVLLTCVSFTSSTDLVSEH